MEGTVDGGDEDRCRRRKGWEWEGNGRGTEWRGLICVPRERERLGMGGE